VKDAAPSPTIQAVNRAVFMLVLEIARPGAGTGASYFRTPVISRLKRQRPTTLCDVFWTLPRAGALLVVAAAAAACSSEDPPPFVCSVTAPTACAEPAPHYDDVQPIFAKRCTSCHSGMVDGPWPLTSYAHISGWWDAVRDELVTCAMPPRDSGVIMTNAERAELLMWLRCGYQE